MKGVAERENAFEAEFKRNQELAFRVKARRNRLFGYGRLSGLDCQKARRQIPTPRLSSRMISKCWATPMSSEKSRPIWPGGTLL